MILMIVISPFTTVYAESGSSVQAASSSTLQLTGLNDSGRLATVVSSLMQTQIDDHHAPGGSISIVKDRQIIYAQGYGYADVENRTPVVADETLFRIGSCTKTFTAVAVMQMASQGKLDLNADVNTYLKDFSIPESYSRPMTLDNLLIHTAGFEVQDACGKSLVTDPHNMVSLKDYITKDMPAIVRPPGEASSYSNYGYALAGYIVGEASNVSYDRYLEDNIFIPLDMMNTTTEQPVPDVLNSRLAKGYTYSDGSYKAGSFEYVVPYPAGSISATATDMAHYMIARLDGGKYDNHSILDESTAARMLTREYSNDPRLDGMAYGIVETDLNGKRALVKTGDTLLFHSEICLVPDEGLGIFVSFNGDGGAQACKNVIQGFFDRYYPASNLSTPVPMTGYQELASSYAGTYYSARTSYTTLEKIVGGLSQQYDVTANPNGTISLASKTFVEVTPLYFEELNGTNRLVFREDADGTQYLFVGSDPEGGSLVKAKWYQIMTFHLALLAVCLIIFISALIIWPVSWLLSRRKKKVSDRTQAIARWASAIACILNIGFVVGFMLLLTMTYNDLAYGVTIALLIVLTMPIIAALFTIGALGFTALAWRRYYWSLPGRIYYTIVTIALLSFLWFLNYWNLLGYHI